MNTWARCGLMMILTLLFASAVQAQWTTGTNINNTNSGNVNVGSTAPTEKLTVTNPNPGALGVYRDLDVTSVGAAGTLINLGARNGSTFTTGAQITGVLDNPASEGFLTLSTRTASALYERLRISASGNVGIGTSVPSRTLDVNGIIQSRAAGNGGGAVYFDSAANFWRISQTATGSSGKLQLTQDGIVDVMTLTGSGKVGIGTVNPGDKLSVEGSVSAGILGAYVKNTAGTASGTLSRFSVGQTNTETSALLIQFSHNDDNAVILNRKSVTGTLDLNTTGGGIHISNNGYVGIGTPSPGDPLAVNGSLGIGANKIYNGAANNSAGIDFATAGLVNISGFSGIVFNSSAAGIGSQTERMRITNSGTVGIGTPNPGALLDVNGTARFATLNATSAIQLNGTSINTAGALSNVVYQNQANTFTGAQSITGTGNVLRVTGASTSTEYATIGNTGSTLYFGVESSTGGNLFAGSSAYASTLGNATANNLQLATNNTVRLTVDPSGNVGIGTPSPEDRFTVDGTAPVATVRSGGYLKLRPSGNDWDMRLQANGSASNAYLSVYSGGDLTNPRMVVQASGNVGIGRSDPTYKLDVNGTAHVSGNVTIDGNLAAKYQDVAEWVPSSEPLSPGTVVVLDSTKSNQVTSSTTSYDTRVAGVVSEQPGIALGEKSDSKVLVATTGRVRVKVDATKSPIHIGDLLVTSDVPGMAMKSEPIMISGRQIHAPGTLIGKALEPLEKGKGEILVLLSLQ
jgi:hypothetical protein